MTLLGENRAQDLEEKADRSTPTSTGTSSASCSRARSSRSSRTSTLIHSVASESALKQLETHATPETEILIEVNVAGEADKAGIAPEDLPRYLEASPCKVVGLMTMPPFTEDPED